MSLFSCPIIENFIWIDPLLRGHLSYKATFSLSQRWLLNTGLTTTTCYKFLDIWKKVISLYIRKCQQKVDSLYVCKKMKECQLCRYSGIVWCHRMSENLGVRLYKFHCIYKTMSNIKLFCKFWIHLYLYLISYEFFSVFTSFSIL